MSSYRPLPSVSRSALMPWAGVSNAVTPTLLMSPVAPTLSRVVLSQL